MKKQLLKNKLIEFQLEIVALRQQLNDKDNLLQKNKRHSSLTLIELIDSFENIFVTLDNKLSSENINEEQVNKTNTRGIKSCRAVLRKIKRNLEDDGINIIELADNIAQPGLCKIVETQRDTHHENGFIIEIVKDGYQRGENVIRPSEVITVSNI